MFQEATALSEAYTSLEPSTLTRRSFYGDGGLYLARDDAQAFGDELQALYEDHLTLGKPEGKPYFLFVGFTPL